MGVRSVSHLLGRTRRSAGDAKGHRDARAVAAIDGVAVESGGAVDGSVQADAFCAATADILDIRYTRSSSVVGDTTQSAPDILINTSCEHLNDFAAWFDGLPPGVLLVLQSNDYVSEPEHVNCVEDLEAFKAQAPLAHLIYAGGLELNKYTRFMLIGRK